MLEGKRVPHHRPSKTALAALCLGTTCAGVAGSPPAALQPGQVDPHYAVPDATGTLDAGS